MKRTVQKLIGIIGGMGPEASAYFYELLIRHAQNQYGVRKNNEYPDLYLASVPVPDFITDEKDRDKALNMLRVKMREMESLPISFYCMACNTGHLMIDTLRSLTKKPFISLLEEVPQYLRKARIRKIGLLATPTTIRTKLYEKPLNGAGIEVIVPNKNELEMLGGIILQTIAGKNKEENSDSVQSIARNMLDKGAEGILESCTEIPLIFPKQKLVPVFDTLEILAEAVLEKYYN